MAAEPEGRRWMLFTAIGVAIVAIVLGFGFIVSQPGTRPTFVDTGNSVVSTSTSSTLPPSSGATVPGLTSTTSGVTSTTCGPGTTGAGPSTTSGPSGTRADTTTTTVLQNPCGD